MFPFASYVAAVRLHYARNADESRHKKYGYDLSFADKELKEAGDLAKSYGHRLTMHPGQVRSVGAQRTALTPGSSLSWARRKKPS